MFVTSSDCEFEDTQVTGQLQLIQLRPTDNIIGPKPVKNATITMLKNSTVENFTDMFTELKEPKEENIIKETRTDSNECCSFPTLYEKKSLCLQYNRAGGSTMMSCFKAASNTHGSFMPTPGWKLTQK